ncbi:hypothetical protein FEM48_Zijuj11G0153600 [Ziziphus jujuba var. spinosa]|uniref:Uncharacterized protein n=1 Tax=Ziziphus jujuba var. spinosa TaxID=714518 RepID=A0A978UJQ6_ZIZJJ|nr:hypothetical protein FEM48_Zijuj11G0153600 [Ziziphus jujuba var. spinosa]
MALNVFGKPIGNETLKAMPTYQDKELITAVDRAYEALIMKNADNKDVNARKFVESLKKKAYWGLSIPVAARKWSMGCISSPPDVSPVAATIYRGQDESGDAFDWMLSWQNVWNDKNGVSSGCLICGTKTCDVFKRSLDMLDPLQLRYIMIYTEVREAYSIHDDMSRKLRKFDHYHGSAEGCYSTVITGYSDVVDS